MATPVVPTHQKMKLPSTHLAKLFPFLRWWPLITRSSLRDDLLAGFSGALIVLPQGVAFATIAGLPPQYGLYAAMVPAVIGALRPTAKALSNCLLGRSST